MVSLHVVLSEEDLPAPNDVLSLYASAAKQPPLNESVSTAKLFASLYQSAVKKEHVVAVTAFDHDQLVAFAYGHPWSWDEQVNPWADELRVRLGADASLLDGTYSLNLLARDPREQYRGLGRSVLDRWLQETGNKSCWLQTTDIDSPARSLYSSFGFRPLGHGPVAPNGEPGLVLLRSWYGPGVMN